MSLKTSSSQWLMASAFWLIVVCVLWTVSWSVSAQSELQNGPEGPIQIVDGVLIRQEGEGFVRQMKWDPTDEVLLVAWGPDAVLLDRNFNVVQQVSDDQWPWSVSWNPSGREFLVTTRTGYQIWAWDGQTATLARETLVANEIVSAYWSNFGTKIATVERLPGELFAITVQVVIRSAATSEVLQTSVDYFGIPTEDAIADQWDWSPLDDRYLYGVGYTVEIRADGLPYVSSKPMVYRLDTETGITERVTTLISGLFYSIGLDPNGDYLVATDDIGIKIWSFRENRIVVNLTGAASGVSWRRDGQFVMAGPSAIDITTREGLGWFDSGGTLVRMNSRYSIVALASFYDNFFMLHDLTAFDAYEPMLTPVPPATRPFPQPTHAP